METQYVIQVLIVRIGAMLSEAGDEFSAEEDDTVYTNAPEKYRNLGYKVIDIDFRDHFEKHIKDIEPGKAISIPVPSAVDKEFLRAAIEGVLMTRFKKNSVVTCICGDFIQALLVSSKANKTESYH